MKKIILLFLLTFLIPITNVNGYYCKFSEISRYKSLASNIVTTYDYEEQENSVEFSITLVNLSEELYIVDTSTNKKYDYSNNELTIQGYSAGETVKFNVYTTNKNCSEELLYTIRVVLPSYNPFYKDEACKGAESYIFCQKWYKNNLDYETFVSKVNEYKKVETPAVEEEPIIIVDDYSLLNDILDIVLKYYQIVLISIIIICSIIIYITNKKSDIYSR